ncbi:MAG: ATP-binding cassette domain-containing protein [Velocimicrobium sp.]
MDKIIEVNHLKKSYGSLTAVKNLDFYVERGKLFAFLGPNGAGKSTTINTICTFLEADEGNVVVDGHTLGSEDEAIRESIGVVFQESLLDSVLTVEENLMLRGSFYGSSKRERLERLKVVAMETEIVELLKRPYGKLSGGQRRRCDIARALLHTPNILFLDEPTTGLDPQTRKSVWDTIKRLQKEQGMTVFLTTHYMEEAKEADYVIVIDHGEIAAKGTPAQLKEEYASDSVTLIGGNVAKMEDILDSQQVNYHVCADQIVINVESTMEALPIIESCKTYFEGFTVSTGTMDDAFIHITGKEIRE